MKEIFTKLSSGRYILTLIGGSVFAYVSYKGIIDKDIIANILTMIFISYFQRDRTKENGQPK